MKSLVELVKWVLEDIDHVLGLLFLLLTVGLVLGHILHAIRGCP